MLSPPLPLSIKFSLSGKQIEFRLDVIELGGADEVLKCFESSLSAIKAIPDI